MGYLCLRCLTAVHFNSTRPWTSSYYMINIGLNEILAFVLTILFEGFGSFLNGSKPKRVHNFCRYSAGNVEFFWRKREILSIKKLY